MRLIPFLKPTKGVQIAGGGFPDSGGGGGSYTLPPATANTLGGVKVGTGLSVTGDGTLSASGGGGGGVVISTTETKIGTYNGADLYCKMYVAEKSSSGYSTAYVTLDSGYNYVYGTAVCENINGKVCATHVDFAKETPERAAVYFNDGIVNLSSGDTITLVAYYTKN